MTARVITEEGLIVIFCEVCITIHKDQFISSVVTEFNSKVQGSLSLFIYSSRHHS